MTTIIQDAHTAHLADLLRSFKESVWDLRLGAERLKRDLEAGEQTEIGSGSKELSQARGLVTACQKVEMFLAEVEAERRRAGAGAPELDMDAARVEIGRRLARLRNDGCADDISE